ncbi:membrane protein [Actinocorallia aurea]
MAGVGAVLVLGVAGCGSVSVDEATVQRWEEQGIDADLLFLIEVPGFTAAGQSIGVMGEDGLGMSYTSDANPGDLAHLLVERHPFDGDRCAALPVPDADPAATVECVPDRSGWYRTSGGFHEYVLPLEQGHVRLSAPQGAVTLDALRATLAAAESLSGISILNTPWPTPSIPRGDLPSVGDGAPDNSVNEGG